MRHVLFYGACYNTAMTATPFETETRRLERLCEYERAFYDTGLRYVAGVDEVGRGPLAGPVLACAVILPTDARIRGIDDSKRLSPKKREALAELIRETAVSIGVGSVDEKTIDEINILQATREAMRRAVAVLSVTPEAALIDGNDLPGLPEPIISRAVVKGDRLSQSVAAASVIAKTTRDRIMIAYHEIYPEYGFDANKGYGTPKHIEAIRRYGLCPIHRRSFCRSLR